MKFLARTLLPLIAKHFVPTFRFIVEGKSVALRVRLVAFDREVFNAVIPIIGEVHEARPETPDKVYQPGGTRDLPEEIKSLHVKQLNENLAK